MILSGFNYVVHFDFLIAFRTRGMRGRMSTAGRGPAAGTSSTLQAGRTRFLGFRVLCANLSLFFFSFVGLQHVDAALGSMSAVRRRRQEGRWLPEAAATAAGTRIQEAGTGLFLFSLLPHFTFLTRVGQYTRSFFITYLSYHFLGILYILDLYFNHRNRAVRLCSIVLFNEFSSDELADKVENALT